MKGDFSRLTTRNARAQRYEAVLLQQGRVLLDSDWNEAQLVEQDRLTNRVAELAGLSGAPRHASGFEITQTGGYLYLGPGAYYVDGLRCWNEGRIIFDSQPYYLDANQEGYFGLAGKKGLVYLDVWQRAVTAMDDETIREQALGGPDTAARLQTVWQVKILPLAGAPDLLALRERIRSQQDLAIPEWNALLRLSPGQMTAAIDPGASEPPSACVLPPQAGYSGLENQLYRVEIHTGNLQGGAATFKWSRDNGSVAAAIETIAGTTVTLHDTGRDETLGFTPTQWVEITSDLDEFAGAPRPGQLAQIATVNRAERTIELAPPGVAAVSDGSARHYKLRRWDRPGADIAITPGQPYLLEDKITVTFSGGPFRSGDYWLIPARTEIDELDWHLPGSPDGAQPVYLPPEGVEHHFAPLALVDFVNNGIRPSGDLRLVFPPLNELRAADVRYDDGSAAPLLKGLQTVQEAIDRLSKVPRVCTISAYPQQRIEAVFAQLQPGQDARICFPAGEYFSMRQITIQNMGHVFISGAGPGSHLHVQLSETLLRFVNCKSVTVQDVQVESHVAAATTTTKDLNGVLTFQNCGAVTVERAALSCGAAATRQAACLSVLDAYAASGEATWPDRAQVRVRGCEFAVGYMQVGVVLLNANRAQIEDNVFIPKKRPARLKIGILLQDRAFRAAFRRLFLYDMLPVAKPDDEKPARNLSKTVGEYKVRFNVPDVIKADWIRILQRRPNAEEAAKIRSTRDLAIYLAWLLDRILLEESNMQDLLDRWIKAVSLDLPPVMSQAIVIGGQTARDVRICNNTMQNVLEGIHLGVSHSEVTPTYNYDYIERVIVAGNTIHVHIPSVLTGSRYGIYLGNCWNGVIEDNYVTVTRSSTKGKQYYIAGICAWGYMGALIRIQHNHLAGCNDPVIWRPLGWTKGPVKQSVHLIGDNATS